MRQPKSLSREQRRALKNLFDRVPLVNLPIPEGSRENYSRYIHRAFDDPVTSGGTPITYRQFRRHVYRPGYDDCVMVPWCQMWLGIETDGYTHS